MSRSTSPTRKHEQHGTAPLSSKQEGGAATWWLYALAVAAVVVEALSAAWWMRSRFLRYVVEGESMEPVLHPGDWVIADRGNFRAYLPKAGDVVLARDPEQPSRTLVKRIDYVDLHGQVWLAGDNTAMSRDSRSFGAIPAHLIFARVRWRYWPRPGRVG